MSLNKYMHPKNPFKKKKPDFKALSEKYPFFAEVTERKKGGGDKVEINFKEPRSQYALSKALMKEYFDLNLSLPLDRLIPTIPLRVNYLLWIDEILSVTYKTRKALRGLDIGTGASCIYPIIGAKVFKWEFVCTEIDKTNFDYAVRNIVDNDLQSSIQLLKVDEACVLSGALFHLRDKQFDFVMANPPFFSSSDEAYGFTSTRDIDKRSLPVSASTASQVESVRHGGEVLFVCQLIHESLEVKEQIKVFSSMLGKKQSLNPIKRVLRALKVPNWSVYDLCQGRVTRWGIAWSFDPLVVFPRSPFQMKKLQLRPPLTWVVPEELQCLDAYDRVHLCALLKELFKHLQIHCLEQKIKGNAADKSLIITATTNTWSNQRRKRRAGRNPKSCDSEEGESAVTSATDESPQKGEKEAAGSVTESPQKGEKEAAGSVTEPLQTQTTAECSPDHGDEYEPSAKRQKTESSLSSEPCSLSTSMLLDDSTSSDEEEAGSAAEKTPAHLLKARLFIREVDGVLTLEMHWISGTNREVMNQVFQYLKNTIK